MKETATIKRVRDLYQFYAEETRQVYSVLSALQSGDQERLRKAVNDLDTNIREEVLPLLTKKERKKTNWRAYND